MFVCVNSIVEFTEYSTCRIYIESFINTEYSASTDGSPK